MTDHEDGTAPGGFRGGDCGYECRGEGSLGAHVDCPVHGTNRLNQGTCEPDVKETKVTATTVKHERVPPQSARAQLAEAVRSWDDGEFNAPARVLLAARRVLAEPEPVSREAHDRECRERERTWSRLFDERDAHAKTRAELERVQKNSDLLRKSVDRDLRAMNGRQAERIAELEDRLQECTENRDGWQRCAEEKEAEVERLRGVWVQQSKVDVRLRRRINDLESCAPAPTGDRVVLDACRKWLDTHEDEDPCIADHELHQAIIRWDPKTRRAKKADRGCNRCNWTGAYWNGAGYEACACRAKEDDRG